MLKPLFINTLIFDRRALFKLPVLGKRSLFSRYFVIKCFLGVGDSYTGDRRQEERGMSEEVGVRIVRMILLP
ncbi:hypothetical protein [Okeania sp. SIO1I7]|uniref:hypothetical protein n=1 Tax=Okeania sp. SIO1I7 TaxID=2607772 RepID=UPI0013FCD984|nr:hypothetical protein [Okeania sp. SIO1I7]NET30178.1 hypothetical protein [Okeania sp. SIO1I7]